MPDLNTFHSLVSTVVNRGTRYDDEIVTMTRQAVRWFERNHTLKYMDKFTRFNISAAQEDITFGQTRIKEIHFLRIMLTSPTPDGSWKYLEAGEPMEFTTIKAEEPAKYWYEEGTNRIVLDVPSDAAYNIEMFYSEYTDWPVDTVPFASTEEHWLLSNADDVLLAQVMLLMLPILKNPKIRAEFQPLRDEGLHTLMAADERFRQSNKSVAMAMYTG